LHSAAQRVVAEEQRVTPRCQRCALTARRDVARPKIREGGHTEPFGDHRRFTKLQRRTGVTWRDLVPHGLPVAGDQVSANTRPAQRERGGAGESFTEQDVDLTYFVDAALLGAE